MPSKDLILELQTIFREEYGKDIALLDAEKAAVWLTSYFDLLAQISFESKKKEVVLGEIDNTPREISRRGSDYKRLNPKNTRK